MLCLRFCVYVGVQTCTIILGLLGTLTYISYIILCLIGFIHSDSIAEKVQAPNSITNDEDWKLNVEIYLGCLFLVALFNLFACAMLILGARKENRPVLLPWLIGGMTSIIFTTFTVLSLYHKAGEYPTGYTVIWAAIGFEFFLWLCVYSLFQNLLTTAPDEQQLLVDDQTTNIYQYQSII